MCPVTSAKSEDLFALDVATVLASMSGVCFVVILSQCQVTAPVVGSSISLDTCRPSFRDTSRGSMEMAAFACIYFSSSSFTDRV